MGHSDTSRIRPIVKAICQELDHGNLREKLLVAVLEGNTDNSALDELDDFAPFRRVRVLSDGFRAGAAGAPCKPPWWVVDRGATPEAEWRKDHAKGARERDNHYDPTDQMADYIYEAVPGPTEE